MATESEHENLQAAANDIDRAIRAFAVRCGLMSHYDTQQTVRNVLAHIEKHVECQRRELVALRTMIASLQLATADHE
jgi:hypothetical protein